MRPLQRTTRLATLSAAAALAGAAHARDGAPPGMPSPEISLSPPPSRPWLALATPPSPNAPAAAQDSPAPAVDTRRAADPPPAPDPRVHFSVSPYAWLTSQSGDTTISGITMDAGISFSELLDKSDTLVSLMGAVDVQIDRLVFQVVGDYAQVTFKGSRGVFRNGTVTADIAETLARCELLAGYRFLDNPLDQEAARTRRLTLDGFVGGRITAVDLNSTLSASAIVTLPDGDVLNPGTTRERGVSKEWVEPFVGARLGLDLTDHWSLTLRGDLGGFGISGAAFAWSTAALAGYRWDLEGWTLTAFAGYRVLGQDYTSGDFGWNVITFGPLMGARISLSF